MNTQCIAAAAALLLVVACSSDTTAPAAGTGQPVGGGPIAAHIVVTPESPIAGNLVTLSSAMLTTNAARSWGFGDGTSDTGVVVQHLYSAAGTYNVNVTLDNGWTLATTVTVLNPGAPDPQLRQPAVKPRKLDN